MIRCVAFSNNVYRLQTSVRAQLSLYIYMPGVTLVESFPRCIIMYGLICKPWQFVSVRQ